MKIPTELRKYFNDEHFSNYPKIGIPQEYIDERGSIRNIADGQLGDVAIISCQKGAIRANHIHSEDWHLSYLVMGSMKYSWSEKFGDEIQDIVAYSGDLIYTQPKSPHQMEFLEDSIFVAVSRLSRMQSEYEGDTKRLEKYF
jgi:uncharacterized RmlC-like cupin family protein